MKDNTGSGNQFKVGDKIKCLNDVVGCCTEGEVYGIFTTDYSELYILDDNCRALYIFSKDGTLKRQSYQLNWELVVDSGEVCNNTTSPYEHSGAIKSDGGSSSYYSKKIPQAMLERFNSTGNMEVKDVIRLFLGNDFNMSNVFKAYCRVTSLRQGQGKHGVDEKYDLTKAVFFAQDELDNYLENTNV